MRGDIRLGPIRLSLETLLVAIAVGLIVHPAFAFALFTVIGAHELFHALAAKLLLKRPFMWVFQLTGAGIYVREQTGLKVALVILSGPVLGALSIQFLGRVLYQHDPGLREYALGLLELSILWNGYQLLPMPPMDGGVLLRPYLTRWLKSATKAWRLSWLLGLSAVALLLYIYPKPIEPIIWLTGMSFLLARSEAGYVRHLDAYEAFRRQDFSRVIQIAHRVPDHLPKADQVAVIELGVLAALELEHSAHVEQLAARLPACHGVALDAASWLLRQERGFGARLAEQAYDAVDAERVKRKDVDWEAFSDLTFRHAIYEAAQKNYESALGLLERAFYWGFNDFERMQVEGHFDSIREHPRYQKLVEGQA